MEITSTINNENIEISAEIQPSVLYITLNTFYYYCRIVDPSKKNGLSRKNYWQERQRHRGCKSAVEKEGKKYN